METEILLASDRLLATVMNGILPGHPRHGPGGVELSCVQPNQCRHSSRGMALHFGALGFARRGTLFFSFQVLPRSNRERSLGPQRRQSKRLTRPTSPRWQRPLMACQLKQVLWAENGRVACLPNRTHSQVRNRIAWACLATTTTLVDEGFSLSSLKGGEGRGEEVNFIECPSPQPSPHSFLAGRRRKFLVCYRDAPDSLPLTSTEPPYEVQKFSSGACPLRVRRWAWVNETVHQARSSRSQRPPLPINPPGFTSRCGVWRIQFP